MSFAPLYQDCSCQDHGGMWFGRYIPKFEELSSILGFISTHLPGITSLNTVILKFYFGNFVYTVRTHNFLCICRVRVRNTRWFKYDRD